MLQATLQQTVLGNTVESYFKCALIFFACLIVLKIVQWIIVKHLTNLAKKTKTTFDDFIIKVINTIVIPFSYFGVFYFCLKILAVSEFVQKIFAVIFTLALTLFAAKIAVVFLNYGSSLYLKKTGKGDSFQKSIDGIIRLIKFIIWVGAACFFLDNMGFKISAVIAGLGIGGIAVALAAQAVLKDLFSYFSILFDRPFEVGDFIITGEHLGVIEKIGIKTTRISSLGGEQIIFSNTDLTNSRVRNYKRMLKRRVVFKLGITYDTPLEKIKQIPGIIENIVKKIDNAALDRAHFSAYGDFSLIYEIVYYVTGGDYNRYMNIQQEINFSVKEAFEELKVEFAFPTQTLYVNKTS
jgi:small-conductance mechanosensitive channel